MKRYKVNKKASTKKFGQKANRTHRINKSPAAAFLRRGGIRL